MPRVKIQKKKPARKPRKKTNNKTKHDKLKILNIILLMLVVTLTITLLSYIYMEKSNLDSNTTKEEIKSSNNYKNEPSNIQDYKKELEDIRKQRQEKYEEQAKRFEEITDEFYKEYIPPIENNQPIIEDSVKTQDVIIDTKKDINESKEEIIEPIIEPSKQTLSKKEEIKKTITKKEQPKKTDTKVINKTNLPKLAIIIDDVTATHEIRDIKKIPYTVNISIMPPTKSHKKSADIAKGLDFYMIHFPMQATSFKFEEDNTLHIGDNYEKIEKRVAQIRKWYPNAIYTNNHTGSQFTADEQSMEYLFKALKKYNFIFVDSRTTAKSVAQEMAKKHNMPYIARNIFLDNEQNYKYIQDQLKKAIDIAKKKGYAIAIGHPHKMTMKVLRESKPLLEGLELVYVDKIPKR